MTSQLKRPHARLGHPALPSAALLHAASLGQRLPAAASVNDLDWTL
jgi:hypothetical protein